MPVVPRVKELLDLYRLQLGNPTSGVMFSTAHGTPIALHNLYYDRIDPILNPGEQCGKSKEAHHRSDRRQKDHEYRRREGLVVWHGWHAFRRGLRSNLYELMPDIFSSRGFCVTPMLLLRGRATSKCGSHTWLSVWLNWKQKSDGQKRCSDAPSTRQIS